MTNGKHALNSNDTDVRVIGISGKIGSGKSTLAEAIVKIVAESPWTDPAQRLSFAGALRAETTKLIDAHHKHGELTNQILAELGVPTADKEALAAFAAICDNAEDKINVYEKTEHSRQLLQHWGGARRAQDPDYWVVQLRDAIRNINQESVMSATGGGAKGDTESVTGATPTSLVIVDDMRYPNEADMLRGLGGVLIRLEVSPENRLDRIRRRDNSGAAALYDDHPSENSLDDYEGFHLIMGDDRLADHDLGYEESFDCPLDAEFMAMYSVLLLPTA